MTAYTLSESAQRALTDARDEALRRGHEAVGAEHIIVALLRQNASLAADLFRGFGLETSSAEERLLSGVRKAKGTASPPPIPSPDAPADATAPAGEGARGGEGEGETIGGTLPYTSHARRLVELATREARARNSSLSAEHLALAAVAEPRGTVARLLNESGVTPAQARAEALRRIDGGEAPPAPAAPAQVPPAEPASAPPAPGAVGGMVASAEPPATTPVPREARESGGRRNDAKREAKPEPKAELKPDAKPPREPRDQQARKDRGPKAERPERPERKERGERAEARAGRPERAERADRAERPDRADRTARSDHDDRRQLERREPQAPRLLPHLEAARHSVLGPLWRKVLLLAVPAAVALYFAHASPVLVFVAACLGVLPLAGMMGDATEHLAERTGPTLGGLLNATFGNAAELIIALVALQAGKIALVKASITGSILGNLLLIMGLAVVAASRGRPIIRFNRTAAGMSAAMMALAVVGLVLPALFHATHPRGEELPELYMSEGVSLVLVATYVCSLLFSLRTHKDVFRSEGHAVAGSPWPVGKAATVLALATIGVAVMSELLVHAVEDVTATIGISEVFLGLIIIPIIGNAAEHAAAVVVARKGQVDLALQIALGSSTQIALLVAPVLVFAGLVMGQGMNLVFTPFEVMALGLATVVTAIITLDGESHWFEGVQLLAVYAMIAVAAFFI